MNNNTRFRTPCGVAASLLTVTIMMCFAVIRIIHVYDTKPMEFQTHMEKMSNQTLNLNQFNLGFGFDIEPQNGEWKVDLEGKEYNVTNCTQA